MKMRIRFVLIGSLLVFLIFSFTSYKTVAQRQSIGPQETKKLVNENPEQDAPPTVANNYGFSEPSPAGNWVVRADIDLSQSDNPDVPVVLAGIRMYGGKGAWRKQLMIESATLSNRTHKQIQAIKLGWIILSEQDRNARKNREAALVDGYTESFQVTPPLESFTKLKSVLIDFVKLAKPLVQGESLDGSFFIRVRVSEVSFSDGSVWKEDEIVPSASL